MIDLHCHILPNIDDGARTVDDSLDMARAFVADGVFSVAATPHVRDDYPTTVAQMEAAVGLLRYELASAGIDLEVLTGAEIALDYVRRLTHVDLRRFGLGGSPAFVLVEFPYYGWPLGLAAEIERLASDGITPVIAHPERNREVQAQSERMGEIVARGGLLQVTAASVDGRLGRRAQRCAFELIELGLVHLLASDAHHPMVREVGLTAATETIGDPRLAEWLTFCVPDAIVRGKELPPLP